MADLAKFHQTKRKFMDLTILANFQLNSSKENQFGGIDNCVEFSSNSSKQSQLGIHFGTYLPNFTLHILNTVSYLAFSIASRLLPVHSQFVMYPWLQSIRLMFGLHNARKWGLNSPTYVFPSRVMSRLISEPYKNKDIVLNNLKRIGRN